MKKKKLFPLSIRSIIMLLCLPFIMLVLFASTYLYHTAQNHITSLIQTNAASMVTQTCETINDHLNSLSILPNTITSSYYHYNVRKNIAENTTAISPEDYKNFSNLIYNFVNQNSLYFDSAFFYLDDNSITLFRSNSAQRLYQNDFDYLLYKDLFRPYELTWITQESGVYPYKVLPSAPSENGLIEVLGDDTTSVHGVLFLEINDELFTSTLTNCRITQSSCLTLVKDGDIQYTSAALFGCDTLEKLSQNDLAQVARLSSQAEPMQSVSYEDENFHFIYQSLNAENMGVIAVIPIDEMYLDFHHFSKPAITFMALFFIICLIIYFMITNQISRPIFSLTRQLRFISDNHLDTSVQIRGSREITMICSSINGLITEVNHLMQNLKTEMLAKQNAELRVLYAQINPHFLYNALDCIQQLCNLGEIQKAETMLSQLAVFYRIGVSKGMESITLRDEITHVKMYLKILKVRFEDFSYQMDVPEEYLGCCVIKLLLQPIVENAIYHGLRPYRTDGLLTITARQMQDSLLLIVSDNGQGISEQMLAQIKKALDSPIQEKPAEIYGIKNVHDRIRLTYGPDYGLSIESSPDQGTTVTLCLPYRTPHSE